MKGLLEYEIEDMKPIRFGDYPMISGLQSNRVFYACPTNAGTVAFIEQCDDFFASELTPDETRALAAELIQIADDADKVKDEG